MLNFGIFVLRVFVADFVVELSLMQVFEAHDVQFVGLVLGVACRDAHDVVGRTAEIVGRVAFDRVDGHAGVLAVAGVE